MYYEDSLHGARCTDACLAQGAALTYEEIVKYTDAAIAALDIDVLAMGRGGHART